MGYYICIIIGVVIGFSTCAMLTRSKIADELAINSRAYEHLMHAKCCNCEYKAGR
jgi:hypothetical protein